LISILVTDTGSGIASADLSRVFDPYFTTKRGGTGLGLPIAKNIVDGLGGTISVASAAGRGTEIRIDLPAQEPGARPEATLPPEASRAAGRRAAPSFATPR
jgi:two-component system sensor histidine kinase HydH